MTFLGNTWQDIPTKEMGPSSQVCPNLIASLEMWLPLHMTSFHSQKLEFLSFFYEGFGCLFVSSLPLQASSPFLIPNKLACWMTPTWLAPQRSRPARHRFPEFVFLHQPLVNEARVTDHWLDNEFILQTHREQGTFLAHLFAELLTAWLRECCFWREQQTPGGPLMCNRPRFDGLCNTQCKAFSAEKWKETEHWDYFRAIAGNS